MKVLSTGFALQARTEPVSETSNATQFSAFVMGIRDQNLSAEVIIYSNKISLHNICTICVIDSSVKGKISHICKWCGHQQ